jgi:hypothetical protein
MKISKLIDALKKAYIINGDIDVVQNDPLFTTVQGIVCEPEGFHKRPPTKTTKSVVRIF